ncbi:MAG TPA: hypothetical protein VMR94_00250, partial [Hyphomicrobiaceae bacterium]|nr:hypothetical protein [Hyphomicrobiaceae bacterium]
GYHPPKTATGKQSPGHADLELLLAPFRAWELLFRAGLALLPKPAVVSPVLAQLANSTGLALIVASIARPFPADW